MNTLFGIKNCDSVKKARRWIESAGYEYQFHDFREDGLSEAKLNEWLQLIDKESLVNKRSTTWKQLSEDEKDQLNSDHACALIVEHPTLIKRPVLHVDGKLYVGFNPDMYTKIFNSRPNRSN